jgi:hypothetical protein
LRQKHNNGDKFFDYFGLTTFDFQRVEQKERERRQREKEQRREKQRESIQSTAK